MKKEIIEKIEVPQEIEFELDHEEVKLKYEGKETKKRFNLTNISLKKQGNEIIIEGKKSTKAEAKMIGTIRAHLKNMIKGLKENFEYKLAIEYVHFPMTVEVSGNEVVIKNFLGEKKPRKCKVLKNAEVKINKSEIIVSSFDKEIAGQMAANLEKTTIVKGKDKRKFQDGIYITEKCGRAI
jgi:large subunit ribosomal protein L6